MRLTVNLDDDLHRMAKALAIAEDCSISAAVNKLLRCVNDARSHSHPHASKNASSSSKCGLPVVKCKKAISEEDVYRAEEAETTRHWT